MAPNKYICNNPKASRHKRRCRKSKICSSRKLIWKSPYKVCKFKKAV